MTPPSSATPEQGAEEVAKAILRELWMIDDDRELPQPELKCVIVNLTAFADASRQDEHDRIREQHAKDLLVVRASALEEAARLMETIPAHPRRLDIEARGDLAKCIRTLKEK